MKILNSNNSRNYWIQTVHETIEFIIGGAGEQLAVGGEGGEGKYRNIEARGAILALKNWCFQ